LHRSYAVITALLVFSFGFSSAFADEGFVNPDNLTFDHIPNHFLSKASPVIFDPITGQESDNISNDKQLVQINGKIYDISQQVDSESVYVQHVNIEGETFSLQLDTLDTSANIIAVLLLGVPFGFLVYRMSDSDPIPLKYAKLSGVAVFFAMASMLTMPITTGNAYWGFASATSSPENVPTAADSLYFDILSDSLTINGAITTIDNDNSAISLDGTNDYLVLDSNLSEKLEQFSISAWVKPDYKRGAPATLSIVSEADAFELAINNDKVDKNVATFSVFDGIKWHTVQSHTAIPEVWTHVSATYSDGAIKIFVNGAQEGSVRIDGDYSLTHQYGDSTQNSYTYINSQSDILIGAFNPNARDNASLENHFSGLIDDVALYDKLLSSDNINTIEKNNRTPDTILEPEAQSVETQPEMTGTANEYGFVTNEDTSNDQKIEEVAAEGYKVKKPEETKKKVKEVTEQIPEVTEFDESTVLVVTSKTTVCHIPEGNPGNNHTISISENALDVHLEHGDLQPDCETLYPEPQLQLIAPISEETIPDKKSIIRKLVTVSNDTEATFADLPEIESRVQYQWKLFGDIDGKLVDLTHDETVDLKLLDLDARVEYN
jgi:hypothetical protein